MSTRERRDIMVFGSCVSRDTFSILESKGHRLRCYIARQSFISVGNTAEELHDVEIELDSGFQRRMVLDDIHGTAIERLGDAIEQTVDPIILVDLTDERCGVYESPSGAFITRSQELIASGLTARYLSPEWKLHTFGSLTHRLLFAQSATNIKNELIKLGLWAKTALLAVPWAKTTRSGLDTPTSYGFNAENANQVFLEYYDFLEADGWRIVKPTIPALASEKHRWGLAPFHFEEGVYENLGSLLAQSEI